MICMETGKSFASWIYPMSLPYQQFQQQRLLELLLPITIKLWYTLTYIQLISFPLKLFLSYLSILPSELWWISILESQPAVIYSLFSSSNSMKFRAPSCAYDKVLQTQHDFGLNIQVSPFVLPKRNFFKHEKQRKTVIQ